MVFGIDSSATHHQYRNTTARKGAYRPASNYDAEGAGTGHICSRDSLDTIDRGALREMRIHAGIEVKEVLNVGLRGADVAAALLPGPIEATKERHVIAVGLAGDDHERRRRQSQRRRERIQTVGRAAVAAGGRAIHELRPD